MKKQTFLEVHLRRWTFGWLLQWNFVCLLQGWTCAKGWVGDLFEGLYDGYCAVVDFLMGPDDSWVSACRGCAFGLEVLLAIVRP